ncbi:hypothetical protein [Fulvivirga lutea]|uniref:Uncharacterized protein n=1 Tax=Fulvivirga lutea TaxID=2810512 RepID=A0A975A2X9_9BACT|nr:hypothetical protein [Fulvivirga lutea]QSE99012.1 hypothetical protein JR347_07980 [Fulvivirga lutea]
MKNTQLFVIAPEDYTYSEDINLFMHPDSTVIYCMTAPINFYTSLKNDEFDFFFNNSFDVLNEQEFTINDLPGIYFELQEDNKKYHYFYYGDSLVENRILGVVPNGSDQLASIIEFVTTSYYDKDATIDPLENAKFRIYPSAMGFHFETSMMNQFVYLEEGYQKYTEQGENFNSISVSQIARSSSIDNINEVFEIMVSQMENQGLQITDVLFNDTLTVDGNYAKAIGFQATYENSTRIVYVLTAGKNNTIVNVAGNFHHDGMELIPRIHAVASEMKITGGNK